MKTDKYSDRTDVNMKISLYEYGLIRNPDTDKVIFCLNTNAPEGEKPIIKTDYISFEDVKEALQEAPDGYYSFIGVPRDECIRLLKNNFLALDIASLNQYNGYFNEHLYY